MTPCLSHNFPPMYLKRNTTTRLTNPSLHATIWHMKPRLSTWFDQYDGLWGVFTVKKRHNFTQRFDLQGHDRMQIFIYKDVSVCNVYHMFYDKRRVSTQISRLCHVYAQVHTLKDMSSHTFFLFYGDVSEYSLTLSFPLLRLVRRNY